MKPFRQTDRQIQTVTYTDTQRQTLKSGHVSTGEIFQTDNTHRHTHTQERERERERDSN